MHKALFNLADVEYGRSPNAVRDENGEYPIYGSGGLVGWALKPLFEKSGVIVARKGTLTNPTYAKNKYWVIDTAYSALPKLDVDAKWLYYNLSNFDLTSLNEATGVPSISRDYLNRIEFFTPNYGQQQKIANILTTVDSLIEKTQSLIDKYTAVKQGMMHDLFTRGIDIATGQIRPSYEQAPELYKETELGWVPREWGVSLLDTLAERGSGHTPNKSHPEYWNGGVKWVSLADSSKLDNLYVSDTDKNISELGIINSSAVKHPRGTVILSRDAGIGKSAVLFEEMAVSQHFMAWRCGNRMDSYFLYFWMQYSKPKFEAIAMGSTIPTIGLGFFKRLKIAAPHIKEQQKIGMMFLKVHEFISVLESDLDQHTKIKKGLMQDLLTGRVRVSGSDEVANA